MSKEPDPKAEDVATATMMGFQALVEELKQDRQHREKHDDDVVKRLGKYKENPDGSPKRSAFNAKGQRDYPLPALRCEMHAPWKIDKDPEISGLTREEIELVNLLEPGEYRVTLNDGAEWDFTIAAQYNSANKKLELMRVSSPAFDKEHFKQMPPMTTWLRQVLAQHPSPTPQQAAAVMTMKAERAMVEQALTEASAKSGKVVTEYKRATEILGVPA